MTEEKYLTKCCLQQASLGPGLWNILRDSLLDISLNTNAEIIYFCDDTVLLVYGENIDRIEKISNKLMNGNKYETRTEKTRK